MELPARLRSLVVGLVILSFFIACSSEDEEGPLVIPDDYDGANFESNAATELTVLQQLKTLRDEAFKGRTPGVEVSANTLNMLYTSGSPTLKSLVTDYYASVLEGDAGYLNQLALASGGTFVPGETDGDGGTYGSYLFDENGVELEQLIEKGMFGAALYNHAINLLNGELTPATSDRVLAIYGSSPDFPNSTDGAKHPVPDRYAAGYIARRDKNDGTGLYTRIQKNFIALQTAIEAGEAYAEHQQSAIASIKENWEKGNAATVVNYLHAVQSKLSQTNPTDATKASALHEISECIGFLNGWKTIPADQKIISEDQLDELLAMLKAPVDGTPSVYQFALDPENELYAIQDALDALKSIYEFTDQEMEDFKQNWVSVQGR